jgi:hypothetical protein
VGGKKNSGGGDGENPFIIYLTPCVPLSYQGEGEEIRRESVAPLKHYAYRLRSIVVDRNDLTVKVATAERVLGWLGKGHRRTTNVGVNGFHIYTVVLVSSSGSAINSTLRIFDFIKASLTALVTTSHDI